ncbi:MAG: lipopolysaccharide biosynthesis protein [Henriciella sp.]|uniref:oligosaccharide flippase family protein n=1 Tax=Henriciella sp. TaxID=1968823 RepID=UPI003C73542E
MVEHKNVEVSKRLVTINAASSVVARIVNMTALLWAYQYLLRRIPAEEFAVLPVVTSLMVFAPLFFSFFVSGISRYVVAAYARGEKERVTAIISSIVPLLGLASLVFLICGGIFAFHIEHILNVAPQMVPDARIMVLLLVASFSLQMLAMPFGTGYHVRQRFVELNLLGIGRDIIRILLLLTFLLGMGPAVVWVVVATAVSETVYTAIMVARSRRMVPEQRFRRSLMSFAQAREIMGFGLWTTLGRLGSMMYTNAATIVLNLYGTAVDVTSYHIGATFFRQINSTLSLAAQPLQPAMTAMHALDDRRRFAAALLRGGRYGLWVAMAVATPLTVYSGDFITLYLGDDYPEAATVIVLFMIIFPFTSPTILLPMAAMSTARVRAFFLPAFLFQLLGLVIMIWLVRYESLGAVGATFSLLAITVSSQLFYYWWFALKLTDLRLSDFWSQTLSRGLMPALVAAPVWAGMRYAVSPNSWQELLLCAGLGGAVYLFVLLSRCLDAGEKADLRLLLAARLK